MGFGGHGGTTGAYMNHPVALEGYTTPNNMKAPGAHVRIPLGSWEAAFKGTLEWRTVNDTDGVGVVDVAIDQISLATTVRRVVPGALSPTTAKCYAISLPAAALP
jgi:hypothetical protein